MILLAGFIIFLVILFALNYTIIEIILHQKRKKAFKKKPVWEQNIEKEIERVLQD